MSEQDQTNARQTHDPEKGVWLGWTNRYGYPEVFETETDALAWQAIIKADDPTGYAELKFIPVWRAGYQPPTVLMGLPAGLRQKVMTLAMERASQPLESGPGAIEALREYINLIDAKPEPVITPESLRAGMEFLTEKLGKDAGQFVEDDDLPGVRGDLREVGKQLEFLWHEIHMLKTALFDQRAEIDRLRAELATVKQSLTVRQPLAPGIPQPPYDITVLAKSATTQPDISAHRMTDEKYAALIKGFEDRHGMTSAEFFRKWQAGEVPDTAEFSEWAILVTPFDSEG